MDSATRAALLAVPRASVESALAEHDDLGAEGFLARHGYRPAVRWVLVANGREYEPRAVLAAAYAHHTGRRLAPDEGPRALTPEEMQAAFEVHGHEVVDRQAARPRRYWAFAASPQHYRIEDAVNDLDEDTWSVGKSDVGRGDSVLLWKYAGGTGTRGVVALGEVLTDPEDITDSKNPYWTSPPPDDDVLRRVRVRYVVPPGLPLWLDDHPELLGNLSVARATGGSTFKVSPEQWEAVAQAAGGWPAATNEDVVVRDKAGNRLDARFFLELVGEQLTLVMKSRGGTRGTSQALNTQYKAGLVMLLHRLSKHGARLLDALVDSQNMRKRPPEERRIPLDGAAYPLAITDADDLASRLGSGMASVRPPDAKGAGNPTKRIRLFLDLPDLGNRSLAEIERTLSGQIAPKKPEQEPTADHGELDRRVETLRKRGRVPRPPGRRRPRRGQTSSGGGGFERDPNVKAWVLQEANGVCELCLQPAPFMKPGGEPFLEVHHLKILADGGPDIVENAAGLCPNCHRELHLGEHQQEKLELLHGQVDRLRPPEDN